MEEVTITVSGRHYKIVCDEGQQESLISLGEYVDTRAKELTAAVGQVSEPLLLVMACLTIADELSDKNAEIEEILKANEGVVALMAAEEKVTKGINLLSDRIEMIADRVEQA